MATHLAKASARKRNPLTSAKRTVSSKSSSSVDVGASGSTSDNVDTAVAGPYGERQPHFAAATNKVAEQPLDGSSTSRKERRKSSNGKARDRDDRVRDKFTMPARDYEMLDELKRRCRALGIDVKKSELLRVGVATMHALPDDRLAELVAPLVTARNAA